MSEGFKDFLKETLFTAMIFVILLLILGLTACTDSKPKIKAYCSDSYGYHYACADLTLNGPILVGLKCGDNRNIGDKVVVNITNLTDCEVDSE